MWFRIRAWSVRYFDVRPGEGRLVASAFATLFTLMVGHTMLETARDALLLARLPPRALAIVYVAIAGLTLPAAGLATRAGLRFGAAKAFGGSLLVAGAAVFLLFALPRTPSSILVLYTVSGLVGSGVVPQFWVLLATQLSVQQGRRLMGPIAAAGITGGIAGSALASALLMKVPVLLLLPTAAALFAGTGALVLFGLRGRHSEPRADGARSTPLSAFQSEPFLTRILVLVVLSTSTVLVSDYLFKVSVARTIPAENLASFFARYYAVLNAGSLAVHLLASRALVERVGITTAVAVSPLFLTLGGIAAAVTSGSMGAVLLVKGIDGSLRYSLQRLASELLYLPVADGPRARGKPFLDGAVARGTQAVTAVVLLGLAEAGVLSPRGLSIGFAILAATWLVAAIAVRRPYLALLRRAIASGRSFDRSGPDPLDFASAERLVEQLANPNPMGIIAAMKVLERRGHDGLVPALVLFHTDPRVLVHALDLFARTTRTDWHALAAPMLRHETEAVRRAAIRAFARLGRTDLLEGEARDESPRVRAYVAVHLAIRDLKPLSTDSRLASLLQSDDFGVRLGILSALADTDANGLAGSLLGTLSTDPRLETSPEGIRVVAAAAARQNDTTLIPALLRFLVPGHARAAVRTALVAFGDVAFHAVVEALETPDVPRRLRVHLPRTLSRFGTKQAADRLLQCIETDADGLVRYKAIRGLGRMVTDLSIRVSRVRAERLSERNLVEYLRLFSLRTALDRPTEEPPRNPERAEATLRLVRGLLDDKLAQALERAFRLLQIAHAGEDLQAAYAAILADDKRLHENGSEFVETLLFRRNQETLRTLFRLATDHVSSEDRVRRSAPFLRGPAPSSHDDAVVALMKDADRTVARLARVHADARGGDHLWDALENSDAPPPSIQGDSMLLERISR